MKSIDERAKEIIENLEDNSGNIANYLLARNIVLSEDILKELKKNNRNKKSKKQRKEKLGKYTINAPNPNTGKMGEICRIR